MNHTARILILLIAMAVFLPCNGKRFHISNGKNDFPLCTQQQIDLRNNRICKALKNTEKLQCTRKIDVYHIFGLYREYTGAGDFFKGINIEPTGNFKIQTLHLWHGPDRGHNHRSQYSQRIRHRYFCCFPKGEAWNTFLL